MNDQAQDPEVIKKKVGTFAREPSKRISDPPDLDKHDTTKPYDLPLNRWYMVGQKLAQRLVFKPLKLELLGPLTVGLRGYTMGQIQEVMWKQCGFADVVECRKLSGSDGSNASVVFYHYMNRVLTEMGNPEGPDKDLDPDENFTLKLSKQYSFTTTGLTDELEFRPLNGDHLTDYPLGTAATFEQAKNAMWRATGLIDTDLDQLELDDLGRALRVFFRFLGPYLQS